MESKPSYLLILEILYKGPSPRHQVSWFVLYTLHSKLLYSL